MVFTQLSFNVFIITMRFEEGFQDIVGLGFTETIIVIAAILIVIDVFFPTDVTSHIALILFAFLVYWNLEYHFLYRLLYGALSWFVLVGVYYTVWRVLAQRLTNRFLTPDKYITPTDDLKGTREIFRIIDGREMVSVDGDLWPCKVDGGAKNYDSVEITDSTDGILTVKSSNEKE